MGYYPFGSKFFSDLAHYVRSGDFVLNLPRRRRKSERVRPSPWDRWRIMRPTTTVIGRQSTSQFPIIYPKLKTPVRARSLPTADDSVSHLKVEFSFDVAQVAQGNYAPEAYHDFIGFEVAQALLEKSVRKDLLTEIVICSSMKIWRSETYRFCGFPSILPTMTKAAWRLKEG